MDVGIEAGGISAFEGVEELLFVAAAQDVIADVIGFGQGIDDQVMARAVGAGLGGGGLGFLVLGFAVDDAGDSFLGVLADPFPDAHHVPAGRVHQLAALGHQFGAGAHLGAESGDDDHIVGAQARQFLLRGLGGNDLDAHVVNLVVDFRVVNDLAQKINGLGQRKDIAGGVSQVNGPFHAVTKAVFLGQLDGQQAVGAEDVALVANALDQFAAVMGQHLGLDGGHDIRAAEIDLPGRRVAGSVPSAIPMVRVVQHNRGSLARFRRVQRSNFPRRAAGFWEAD